MCSSEHEAVRLKRLTFDENDVVWHPPCKAAGSEQTASSGPASPKNETQTALSSSPALLTVLNCDERAALANSRGGC